jgi:hypothetical protein
MGSLDEEVRSWKLQTFNRPAVAVVLSRLIGTAEHDIIEPIPVENRDPFPVTGYRKIDIRNLYTADHWQKRRCM